MARKKKNDFWDDVDDINIDEQPSEDDHAGKITEDEEWSAAKSLPLKIIMRFLLMVACLVALGSAYIAYEYVEDRYASGSYSTDFYSSGGFADEYNNSVNQLLQLVQAMEADPSVTQVGNEELLSTLVENYMGKDTNFSFMILDGDNYPIAYSDGDSEVAKARIEASHQYVLISNTDGEMTVQSPIAGRLLDKDSWSETLSTTSNTYVIYSAVDNELAQTDAFYRAQQAFDRMAGYFSIARFVGIVAAVIFVICLIFCIMSTGMKRGYDGVCLSWFDKIFTEIALVIMIVVAAGLVYAIRRLMAMDGELYEYASLGLIVVTYIWIIRSYFSIVRRIKAGRLLRCSVIGTIIGGAAGVVGRLPSPLNVIVGAIILIAINGAMVYGVIFMRQYTVKGIPVMFIVAPIVFVIELLALLARGSDNEDEEAEELESGDAEAEETDGGEVQEEAAVEKPVRQERSDMSGSAGPMDWEAMDLGKAIEEAEKSRAQMKSPDTEKAAQPQTQDGPAFRAGEQRPAAQQKTEVLSVEDVEKAILAAGLTPQIDGRETAVVQNVAVQNGPKGVTEETFVARPVSRTPEEKPAVSEETVVQPAARKSADMSAADDGRVNFVQLNKDVRKEYKAALKKRGVGVTVRAPEKPVIIDIDRNSLHMIISDIFTQIERLAAGDSRTYVEVYRQGGKVVYIVKITVADDRMADASAAAAGDGSFSNARKIIEANDGKFVVTLEGTVLKAGMLIDAAE